MGVVVMVVVVMVLVMTPRDVMLDAPVTGKTQIWLILWLFGRSGWSVSCNVVVWEEGGGDGDGVGDGGDGDGHALRAGQEEGHDQEKKAVSTETKWL